MNEGARKVSTSTFILLGRETLTHADRRLGFTVTKKIGCAPERNRIRRRLRESAVPAAMAAPAGWDYVLIAKQEALRSTFDILERDLRYAFARIGTAAVQGPRLPRRGKK